MESLSSQVKTLESHGSPLSPDVALEMKQSKSEAELTQESEFCLQRPQVQFSAFKNCVLGAER